MDDMGIWWLMIWWYGWYDRGDSYKNGWYDMGGHWSKEMGDAIYKHGDKHDLQTWYDIRTKNEWHDLQKWVIWYGW